MSDQCNYEDVIRSKNAEIERLTNRVNTSNQEKISACAEIERLTALTEADGKEIGSYREGTGLRGENRAMMDRIAKLEAGLTIIDMDTTNTTNQRHPSADIACAALQEDKPVYGYCPRCGGRGYSRERRPNGNDKCVNGHTYPSLEALEDKPDE